MASKGEDWVKEILKRQGFIISQLATEDVLAFKENLALIIEEKDNKYPVKVGKTRVYTVAGKRKRFPFKFKQINNHTLKILDKFRKAGKFYIILQIYVVSNMIGRYVNIARRYNTHIFFINKAYFEAWLIHLEKVYLGTAQAYPNIYFDGK